MDLELCPDEGPGGLLASGDKGVDVPDEFCNSREDFASSMRWPRHAADADYNFRVPSTG
jgi:hypothetical protein